MKQPERVYDDTDPTAITIEEARVRINACLPLHIPVERIHCSKALHRIVAEDIVSEVSVPPFRASAMDGYAVQVSESNQLLRIQGRSLAGHPGVDALPAGTCQRITTGARIPDQADAVVQQENTRVNDGMVEITQAPFVGLNVRLPGSDSKKGTLLIEKGSIVGAAQIALLAAHGISELQVLAPLVIALFSTGDELVSPGQNLLPGQIYDANRPLLSSLLTSNAVQVIDLGICKDTETDVRNTFSAAAEAHVVVSSGGVSVGEADFVRSVLEEQGRVDLWKVAMKPGRPLTFGFSKSNQVFFGLPGNPVSAAVTALLFVRPAIRHMLGIKKHQSPPLHLPLVGNLTKNPGRVEFQRAVMSCDENGVWQVSTTGLQDSHVLSSLHKANCLIELSVQSTGAKAGDLVRTIPFSQFSDDLL